MVKFMIAALAWVLLGGIARAQTLDAATWLAGRWVGEGLGGQLEETWSPPAGGQMAGHFGMTRDGAPVFYEFMLLDVVEGGVRMRIKHFNPDFVGWEEKDAWHTFEPVSVSADTLSFNGLILRRIGADGLEIRLTLNDHGVIQEHTLTFRRAPL